MSQVLNAGSDLHTSGGVIAGFRNASATVAPRPVLPADDIAESTDEFENPVKIRVVTSASRRNQASSLIQRRYAWRGYAAAPLERHTNGKVTLSASIEDETVATITAGVDSAEGLYVGRLYSAEVQALRDEGRRLCEFTKLAVDESVRSPAVLAAIFHVAFMYVRQMQRCTDLLIEVNPRHVSFYRRMLGFERAAGERIDPAVGAPAVLLRLDLDHPASESVRLGGRRNFGEGERSFYPYFFAPDEAAKIAGRLGAALAAPNPHPRFS